MQPLMLVYKPFFLLIAVTVSVNKNIYTNATIMYLNLAAPFIVSLPGSSLRTLLANICD